MSKELSALLRKIIFHLISRGDLSKLLTSNARSIRLRNDKRLRAQNYWLQSDLEAHPALGGSQTVLTCTS